MQLTILNYRKQQPPLTRYYLNGFMLYNMLGHVWLDGKNDLVII